MQNLDCIFDLQAPAAMCRGMNNGLRNQHGRCIDGRSFFGSEDDKEWPWGQGGRINAGVMLWEPNFDTYQQMILEVVSDEHPAHIAGPGPEQDLFHVIGPMRHGRTSRLGTIFNFIKCLTPSHLLTKVSQNAFVTC